MSVIMNLGILWNVDVPKSFFLVAEHKLEVTQSFGLRPQDLK